MSEAREHIEMIPEHMREGLLAYIENRIEPGEFLTAVLCNDLKNAFARADHINKPRIGNFVSYLYNYAPMACWGSVDKFERWLIAPYTCKLCGQRINDGLACGCGARL